MRRGLIAFMVAGAALGLLKAQDMDTTRTADSLSVPEFSWVKRLVPLMQDHPKPYRLHLSWDEWGHSDLSATASNPFVPTDLLVGAAYLDGSLGQPILSAVIPAAVFEGDSSDQSLIGNRPDWAAAASPDIPAFMIAPLQDLARTNQTYLFWDQGDYQYQDVQIGGAVQLDEGRNIMTAWQGRNHPGQTTLAGPSRSQYEGNVLQNYLLDYQRNVWPALSINYTLLHQREQVGLPFDRYTADRRRNRTWAHGFHLERVFPSWTLELHGATMLSDLRTSTDTTGGAQVSRQSRRSLSLWVGSDITYRLADHWLLVGNWQTRQRRITDRDLGFQFLSQDHGRLGARRSRRRWSLYGGLAVINSRLAPEGQLALRSDHLGLTLESEATSFFDYPYHGRRVSPDNTSWLPGPVYLRRTTLAFQANGPAIHFSARLAQLNTGDERTAATGGLALDWTPWRNVLQVRGAVTAISSPNTHVFPTRINTFTGLSFTLPLKRTRARPFVSANAAYISNEFAWWVDPRFADSTPYFARGDSTRSAALWINAEAGLKVINFELRFRIYNALGAIIQNSPFYLPQRGLAHNPLRHFSLSWRFLPQRKQAN